MSTEHRLRLCGGRRQPSFVHPPPIPVSGQFEHRLCRRRVSALATGEFSPFAEFGLRPEAPYVRSGETNVLPESPRRHQEMDEATGRDHTLVDFPYETILTYGLTVAE